MRIEAAPNIIELKITEIAPPGLPSAGDVRIEANALINGFSGSCSCWVEVRKFKAFAADARKLFSSFQGSAQLASKSPGEFSLSLSPANSRGYILLHVIISKRLPVQCAMSGAFEVELPTLAQLVSWSEAADSHA